MLLEQHGLGGSAGIKDVIWSLPRRVCCDHQPILPALRPLTPMDSEDEELDWIATFAGFVTNGDFKGSLPFRVL
jgi:hypothetical protein